MTNLSCSPTLVQTAIEVTPGSERTIKPSHGMIQREILSKDVCCVCSDYIWVVSQLGSKATIMEEAFSVADSRAYTNGTPDYLSANAKPLLRCHYACQQILAKQLEQNTFIKH